MKQVKALALGFAILAVSAMLTAETASARVFVGGLGGARVGWGGGNVLSRAGSLPKSENRPCSRRWNGGPSLQNIEAWARISFFHEGPKLS